jgi:hypothetical protein
MKGNATASPKAIAEGRALLDFYHGFDQSEAEERYARAVEFRENAIRLIVLDFHLAFDDMLKDHLAFRLRGQSLFGEAEDREYLDSLSARTIIDLAGRLGVVNSGVHRELCELNALRNTASHAWNLVERSTGTKKKVPLKWHGARLSPQVVQEEFLPHYGDIYGTLFQELTEHLEASERWANQNRAESKRR